MRLRSVVFFLCLMLVPGWMKAQLLPPNQPEQECPGAISVCQPLYTQPNAYQGFGATQELNSTNSGCLFSFEKNDVWYVINITSSGTLAFTITPNTSSNDYDFAVWNVTGQGCPAIYNGLPPIGCNYSGLTGATGLSNTITGGQWSPALNVLAGETYILNVSNFSSSQSGYTLDFSPSTASIFDTVKPKFFSAGTQCAFVNNAIDVTMSEPVKCNSLAADGSDFYITPTPSATITGAIGATCASATSATNKLSIQLSSVLAPGTYWLHAKIGSDGNTLFDNCGNQQDITDSVQFILNPANPPAMIRLDTPACYKARIVLDRGIKCNTVAANGSDFKITGPGTVGVVRALPVSCTPMGLTDTIDVFFDKSIIKPGTYTVNVVTGTDGNSLNDTCGLSVVNTISWVVSDKGYLTLSATPNVLCEKGYVNLSATPGINPPPVIAGCGTNGTVCTNPSNAYQLGTGTANAITVSPFYGLYSDARVQYIYTAAELNAAGITTGTISRLVMNIAQKYSTQPYSNFTIKMGCSNLTSFNTPGDFVPGLYVVYNPKNYNTVIGNNNFQFDQPYDWDGTSSLIVEFCYDNNSATSWDYVTYTTTPTAGGYTAMHKYASSGSGCALNAPAKYYQRPNMTFTECVPSNAVHTYTWTPGDFVEDTTAANTTAFVPRTTVYQMQIMDSNRCYRRDTVSVTVSVRNPKVGPVADTAICIGDHVDLFATGGVNYLWYPAAGLSCTNCANPVATPTTTTTYHAVVYDQYGCSDTLSVRIVVHPLPVITLTNDTTIIWGETVQLNANVPGGLYYLWDPVTGLNNANVPNPLATPQVTTQYTLIAIDTNLCKSVDSMRVIVRTDVPVSIPSAFTPNGDGKNDMFHIANLKFQKIVEFRVFNRWGQEVFSGTSNKGWDGMYKGTAQETGVYNYVIRVAWPDGHVETYKGDVTLLR